jgi:uncharacterized protein
VSASILILPGIGGSGPGHWQSAWEGLYPNARRVPAPDWDHPDRVGWVAALERAVADTGPGMVLVAHSLGCLQVVHWASSTRLGVKGALLVAPPDPEGPAFPAAAVGFGSLPAPRLPFASIVVASANDPYASIDFARRCAGDWGGRLVEAGALGHINADSGLGDWSMGRRWLLELTG